MPAARAVFASVLAPLGDPPVALPIVPEAMHLLPVTTKLRAVGSCLRAALAELLDV